MAKFRLLSPPVAAVISTLALAGCAGNFSMPGFGTAQQEAPPPPAPPTPEIPATIRSSEVVGRWGYAAYHKEPDRARTEKAARDQCNHRRDLCS